MCPVQSEKPVETKYIETQCNCRNKKNIIGIAIEKTDCWKTKE